MQEGEDKEARLRERERRGIEKARERRELLTTNIVTINQVIIITALISTR